MLTEAYDCRAYAEKVPALYHAEAHLYVGDRVLDNDGATVEIRSLCNLDHVICLEENTSNVVWRQISDLVGVADRGEWAKKAGTNR